MMWSWNCKLRNQYVKILVVRTVLIFPSLKLWHPGRCYNVASSQIKAFRPVKSTDAEMRLSRNPDLDGLE